MATTFTSILLLMVFSTKNRAHLIAPEIEPELHAYMGGIARGLESPQLCIGGTSNHVHMLVSLSKHVNVIQFLETVKKESSKWMKTQGAYFRSFYWQEGYGAFSIGQSGVAAMKAYIGRQRRHHKTVSFEEEFLTLLRKYNISYDERYIWR